MTKTWYVLLVCAVILHLSLCRKHILKMPFLRLTFLGKKSPNMTKSKIVKFDTKIKNRIITRYYFVSINTFWCMLIQILIRKQPPSGGCFGRSSWKQPPLKLKSAYVHCRTSDVLWGGWSRVCEYSWACGCAHFEIDLLDQTKRLGVKSQGVILVIN